MGMQVKTKMSCSSPAIWRISKDVELPNTQTLLVDVEIGTTTLKNIVTLSSELEDTPSLDHNNPTE